MKIFLERTFTKFLLLSFLLLLSCSSSKDDKQQTKQDAALSNTYWKLTEIEGSQVTVKDETKEPHFVLKINQNISGNTGCNELYGTYSSSKDNIKFTDIATTKMACLDPDFFSVEIKFLNVLKSAANYKITSDTLELYKDNKLLARFSAVYLK